MDLEAFRFAKAPRKSEPEAPAARSTGLHCFFGPTRRADDDAGAGKKASPKKSTFKRKAEDSVILCKTCRHQPNQLLQQSIGSFVVRAATPAAPNHGGEDSTAATSDVADPIDDDGNLLCSRCRRPMREPLKIGSGLGRAAACPFKTRLNGCASCDRFAFSPPGPDDLPHARSYRRVAKETGVEFLLSDTEAFGTMRAVRLPRWLDAYTSAFRHTIVLCRRARCAVRRQARRETG
jgi:hypothetical protein